GHGNIPTTSTPSNGKFPALDSSFNHLSALFNNPVISTGAPSPGVPGFPFVPALSDSPILSCHVPQLCSFPPKIMPVDQSTLISMLNPSSVICMSRFGPALYSRN